MTGADLGDMRGMKRVVANHRASVTSLMGMSGIVEDMMPQSCGPAASAISSAAVTPDVTLVGASD